MTLSSLLVACSGGGGSAGNRADRVEEKAQPVQSNSEPSSTPIKHPMTNSATNTSLHDKLSMSSHDTSKENSQQSSFQAPLEQEKTNLHKKILLGQVIMFQNGEMRVIM